MIRIRLSAQQILQFCCLSSGSWNNGPASIPTCRHNLPIIWFSVFIYSILYTYCTTFTCYWPELCNKMTVSLYKYDALYRSLTDVAIAESQHQLEFTCLCDVDELLVTQFTSFGVGELERLDYPMIRQNSIIDRAHIVRIEVVTCKQTQNVDTASLSHRSNSSAIAQ